MLVFRSKHSDRYLATTPKVMSSTLKANPRLERFTSRRRYWHLAERLAGLGPDYTVLVRNPYRRVVSYFDEKLRIRVHQAAEGSYELKRHQAIFYPWLGVSTADPTEAQIEALLGMSFDRFVSLLPDVVRLNDHLTPQRWLLGRELLGRNVPLKPNRVVHIEDSDEMSRLSETFSLDIDMKHNVSSPSGEVKWTPAGISVMLETFADDFSSFGYDSTPP